MFRPTSIVSAVLTIVALVGVVVAVGSPDWVHYGGNTISVGIFRACALQSCDTRRPETTGEIVASVFLLLAVVALTAATFSVTKAFVKRDESLFGLVGVVDFIATIFLIVACGTYTGYKEKETFQLYRYGWGFAIAWGSTAIALIAAVTARIK